MSLPVILAVIAFSFFSTLLSRSADQHVCLIEDPSTHRVIKVMTARPCPPRHTEISED